MNTGELVVFNFHESYRGVEKGDLFRVIEVNDKTQQITIVAIDEACLRPDEVGIRKKEVRRGRSCGFNVKKKKKKIRTPAQLSQDSRARRIWKNMEE
ncbi:hypothetical protein LCGC14_2505600 [marine sediment metagenome]|uniref:Uncharacterized protein n=1 Tax=marine sediment metagenome TaxID=412755 RepID=A0A0F9B1B5_9ZZZZ